MAPREPPEWFCTDTASMGVHANGRVVRARIAVCGEHRTKPSVPTNTTPPVVATSTPPVRRARPTVDQLRDRTLPTDRLWNVEDVATCLGFSLRLTEQIVKDPRVPQPRLVSKGGERRWSPSHWQRWIDDNDTTYLSNLINHHTHAAHDLHVDGHVVRGSAEMEAI